MSKRQQPERRERLYFMQWVRHNPDIHKFLYAIEHGVKLPKIVAALLKLLGVKPGISDYQFTRSRHGYHGLWIEFKAGKGQLSEHQKEFFDIQRSEGYKCVVVWHWEDAMKEIQEYLAE